MTLLTHQRYMETFRFPVRDYYMELGFDFSREPFSVSGTEFIVGYEKRKLECSLQKDAGRVLRSVRQMGITQSVLSAYLQETLLSFVAHFGLTDYFIQLIGLDDHYAHGKEENGLRWVRQLPHQPAEVVLIGDTVHDFEVAEAMGTDCILIPGGHAAREKLEDCGSPVLSALGDLLNGMLSAVDSDKR